MKPHRLVWRAGLAMGLVGGGLVVVGAYLMIQAGRKGPSLSLMVVGLVIVLVSQAVSSLAKRQQGINYIY